MTPHKYIRKISRATGFAAIACAISSLLPIQANALSLSLGELVITEIMPNPDGVSDSQGEWFELYNAGPTAIELNGLSVGDTSTATGTLDFGGSFLLAPGSYASAARSVSAGFTPDGIYDSVALNNGGDTLNISNGVETLATLIYGSGESTVAASIAIDLGSLQWFLDLENFYGLGNTGTPGFANASGMATGTAINVLPSTNVVPLPAGVWLLMSGIGMLWARHRSVHENRGVV